MLTRHGIVSITEIQTLCASAAYITNYANQFSRKKVNQKSYPIVHYIARIANVFYVPMKLFVQSLLCLYYFSTAFKGHQIDVNHDCKRN